MSEVDKITERYSQRNVQPENQVFAQYFNSERESNFYANELPFLRTHRLCLL